MRGTAAVGRACYATCDGKIAVRGTAKCSWKLLEYGEEICHDVAVIGMVMKITLCPDTTTSGQWTKGSTRL